MIKNIIILCFIFQTTISLSNENLIITSHIWDPYSGDELINEGVAIEKLRKVLLLDNIELLVEFYPWRRAIHTAKHKENYFGYFPAWPEEVQKGFIASLPIAWSEIGVLGMCDCDELKFENLEMLFKNHKIGLIKTYVYPQEIQNLMQKYPENIDFSKDEHALLKKIIVGRFEVAITDPNVMLTLASKKGIDNIELKRLLYKKELVIAVKDNTENRRKLERLNKLLEEEKADR